MQVLKINRLTIENFKCHRYLNIVMNGDSISVYGDNATGKTSIYDALTWLLFGKDSSGNGEKNIEIKPLDPSGQVADHSAITAVEAVLSFGGEEVTLRRTYKEVWTTRRGSAQEVYDGNTSEYYIDTVPCKKHAFDAKIAELVPEDVFRLLTSVSYFASSLSWQKRREVLFDIAGTVGDRDIMATDSRFAPLLDGMGKHSLEDYKKVLASKRKGFAGAKTEIPARISECQKTIDQLADVNFASAKEEAKALEEELDRLSTTVLSIDNDNATEKKRMEISQVQMDLRKLESENELHRRSQMPQTVDVDSIKRDLLKMQNRIANTKSMLNAAVSAAKDLDLQVASARDRWIAINSEVFTGGTCHACGQALPQDKLSAAMAKFEADKKRRLEDTERMANDKKKAKADAEARAKECEETLAWQNEQVEKMTAEINAAGSSDFTPEDMDGFAEKTAAMKRRIQELSEELFELAQNASSVKQALRDQIDEVRNSLKEKRAVISKEAILEFAKSRIEELRQDAKNAAEALEAIDAMLFLLDEYTRYKTSFVEDSINSLFRIARFRLFKEQANGGVEDRCDVVFNGVPYVGLNNGMKINVGIDIINTLSRHYGVCVPLFLDNAESVTKLENTATQVIRLVVSEEDKELRIV